MIKKYAQIQWEDREKKDTFSGKAFFHRTFNVNPAHTFSKVLVYIGFKERLNLGSLGNKIKNWERGKGKPNDVKNKLQHIENP